MKRPGPFGSGRRRPRRKTIPRSYSRATLIALTRKRMSRKRTTARATSAAAIPLILSLSRLWALRPPLDGVDLKRQAVEGVDANALSGRERLRRPYAPEL